MDFSTSMNDKEGETSLPNLLDYFQKNSDFQLGVSLPKLSEILLIISLDDKESLTKGKRPYPTPASLNHTSRPTRGTVAPGKSTFGTQGYNLWGPGMCAQAGGFGLAQFPPCRPTHLNQLSEELKVKSELTGLSS